MADPHVLYVVSMVVVLALVAWVIAVNAIAPPAVDVTKAPAPPPPPDAPPEPKTDTKDAATAGSKPEAESETKAETKAETRAEAKAVAKAEPEPRAEAAPSFEPERPSRSGLRGDYLDIQDEPKGGEGSGEG